MLLLYPTIANGQPVAHSLAQLARNVSAGEPVSVRTHDGKRTKGSVSVVGGSSLELRSDDGVHRFLEQDLHSVRRADSLANGTVIGAAIGGTLGLFAGAAAAVASDKGGTLGSGEHEYLVYAAIVLGTLTGGWTGRALDDRRGDWLYRSDQPHRDVRITPLVTPRAAAVNLALRW
jgi:hypothetical protein